MRRFFFNDTATTEIYTLSLHDALPISYYIDDSVEHGFTPVFTYYMIRQSAPGRDMDEASGVRSEEHTSELQSRQYLVCRLLLDKKHITQCADICFSRSLIVFRDYDKRP